MGEGGSAGPPPGNSEFGRCDFLYAGAFLGWPAGGGQYLNLFRLIAFCFLAYWGSGFKTWNQNNLVLNYSFIHSFINVTCLIYLTCKKKKNNSPGGQGAPSSRSVRLCLEPAQSGGIFQSLAAGNNCIRKHCFIFNLCFLGGTLKGPVCGPARQVESNLDNYSPILRLFWIV